jgi:hypothetical protein
MELNSCTEPNEEIAFCKTGLVYQNNAPPNPLPTQLNSVVVITNIVDVNTESNTMTIIADITLKWNDSAVSLHGGNDSRLAK